MNTNSNFDAIIFDFGGVLIDINYQLTIDAFKQLGIENFNELYSQANQNDLFNSFETGKISSQRFINELLSILPKGISPNQVVHAWNAMLLDVPKAGIELVQVLKRTHKVFMLSNTNSIHIPVAIKRWNNQGGERIHDAFNHVYLSHEIGLRKPNKEIFEYVCNDQSLSPDRTLFIDDSIQHIEGAQRCGINTHHLTAISELHSVFS